jgi:thermostable 8-oxoguanine DNA glycosylase
MDLGENVADIVVFENIEDLIIEIKGEKVLIDRDVANIYGISTKEVNQAVRNNPDKFPEGYIIELDKDIKNELVKNFDRFKPLKHSTINPKAFSEKGLYMLATILKSKKATVATITIIETFIKIRELSRTIKKLPTITNKKEQKKLVQKSGEIIAEILDDDLETDESETTIELNLAVLKFKHTIKKKK